MVRVCKKKYDINETRKIEQARLNNAKDYWALFKNKPPAKCTNNISSTEFYNHCDINIDTDIDDIIQPNESNELDIMYEELNQPVTVDEVKNSIKQLKSGKSAGLDLLLNEFYIHGQELLAVPLCDLFNCVIKTGHFPNKWSEGLIVPLHKKGDVNSITTEVLPY